MAEESSTAKDPQPKKGGTLKLVVIVVFVGLFAGFLALGGTEYFKLSYIKGKQAEIVAYYKDHKLVVIGAYFAVYVVSTAVSLPGAAILTILAGALFGRWVGTVVVSFASTCGATLAFLASRFVLGNSIQSRFGDKLKTFNDGIEKDGAFYLFTLRLIPAVPFFVINLVMGLTRLKTWTFWWVSQVGMLAGTFVYVNAGTALADIESAADILSLELILSFVALGTFPLIIRMLFKVFGKKGRTVEKPQ